MICMSEKVSKTDVNFCVPLLGVVHNNCQHLPISTESTNLGGDQLAYYFLNVYLFVEHIIKMNASKMYYRGTRY